MKKYALLLITSVFMTGLAAAQPSNMKKPSSSSSPSSSSGTTSQEQSSGTSQGKGSTGGATGGSTGSSAPAKKAQSMPFAIYIDQGDKGNHYIPSGWMGDYGDIKINPGCTEGPHGGKNCFKITYSGKMTNGAGWAGIFWQHPANNWGDKQGGFNLTGAKRLTFWAKGAKGGEKIAEFKVGGITGEYPDSDSQSLGPVELTNNWKQYTIDLAGKDLSGIIGGFAWAASKDDNPDGFIIYLDDIAFE